MFDSIFAALDRILGSKKVLVIFVGAIVNVAAVAGFSVDAAALTEGVGLLFNGAVGVLTVGQFVLDAIHGSASDGTVKELAEEAGFAEELEDLREFISDLQDKVDELKDSADDEEEEVA